MVILLSINIGAIGVHGSGVWTDRNLIVDEALVRGRGRPGHAYRHKHLKGVVARLLYQKGSEGRELLQDYCTRREAKEGSCCKATVLEGKRR